MGTGWRKAFCTTINMVVEEDEASSAETTEVYSSSSKTNHSRSSKFGLLSSASKSNPCTPRLQSNNNSPKLFCNTKNHPIIVQTTTSSSSNDNNVNNNSTKKLLRRCKTDISTSSSSTQKSSSSKSNPSSPRSPFSIIKNTLRLSRNSCGICMQSVKTGQGMAIYTAECSHTFHFPCIQEFLRKQQNILICPICKSPWKDVPLLTTTTHKLQPHHQKQEEKLIKTSPKSHHENPPHVKCSAPKTYHDDEPLISPKFNPIPEENDDEEDEVVEFKGFFVDSTPSNVAFADAQKEVRNVEVSLLPESVVVATGRTNETVALVLKVKAPPPPPSGGHINNSVACRAPVDLVAVLDVSASMSGTKLQMLKRAMRLVISSLGSADRLSIVAFAANPKRIIPLRRMNVQGQRLARRIIDQLACCNPGSCVNEALKKASKILEDRRERNPVASIILLSDGQEENVQVKNDNQRQRSAHVSTTRFSHVEIPVHSSGLSENPVYNNGPAEDAFSKCVGGLLSVVVQDLRVRLSFASGSDLAEIVAAYSCNGKPASLGSDYIRVGDLYAEEEKEFLVEIRVPTSTTGSNHILSVRSSYKDAATQEVVHNREHALMVPRPQAIRSTLHGNERLRNLFISTRAIAESRRLLEHNELNKAMQLLSSARTFVMQYKVDSAKEHVNSLEMELAEVQWRMQCQQTMMDQVKTGRRKINDQGVSLFTDENDESLTPTSAWKAAEKLAKMAKMKKSFSRVGDLHGLENARF